MIKPDYSDPDLSVVTAVDGDEVTVVFRHLLEETFDESYVPPANLTKECEEAGLSQYSFAAGDLAFEPQY